MRVLEDQPFRRALATASATLPKRQKPMGWVRSAWWPGGLTTQMALRSSPAQTRAVASMTLPAERSPAFVDCGQRKRLLYCRPSSSARFGVSSCTRAIRSTCSRVCLRPSSSRVAFRQGTLSHRAARPSFSSLSKMRTTRLGFSMCSMSFRHRCSAMSWWYSSPTGLASCTAAAFAAFGRGLGATGSGGGGGGGSSSGCCSGWGSTCSGTLGSGELFRSGGGSGCGSGRTSACCSGGSSSSGAFGSSSTKVSSSGSSSQSSHSLCWSFGLSSG
mmetsp:Transcript_63923/g.186953  ORF Transcript_63923/g.186953 Transcript_63923/m.186953 type:complete len:273 (-) Transcript_63923:404-1222(-)